MSSKSNVSSSKGIKHRVKAAPRFAVCVENRGYPASLELCKIYRLVPDPSAVALQQFRVIDESGEDYLYPRKFFVPIEVQKDFLGGASEDGLRILLGQQYRGERQSERAANVRE